MSEHEHKHGVKVFIDEQAFHSPNPTTGAALYALGAVKPGFDLFREVDGDHVDPEVDNGTEVLYLTQDEHFHSGPPKIYHIIVNGRKKEVSIKTLTFTQVVALAFNAVPSGPNVQISVTYRKGPKKNHDGTMTEGETVRIKDGMIFDVTETTKS